MSPSSRTGRIVDPETLKEALQKGEILPLYLVMGEDDAGKAALAAVFEETVEEELRAFNVERFYGGEAKATAANLVDAARTLPFCAPWRVILVLAAERLLTPQREGERAALEQETLERYIQAPEPRTAVVFIAGEIDKRRRLFTLLQKHACLVNCSSQLDNRQSVSWVKAEAARRSVRIETEAIRRLVDGAGGDLTRLRSDLDRVLLYAADEGKVTASHVREVTGPASSLDAWGVTRALERGAAAAALRELAALLDAGAAPLAILGQVGWYARTKMPAPALPAAVEALFMTDLALKSSTGDPRMLLERLILELSDGKLRRGR
jgi:DNA polymerase III subunit delta